jgi:hypothetical protein
MSTISDKAKKLKPTIKYVKDLQVGNEKDEIWTLNMQSLLNIKYHIYEETVKDILGEFDLSSLNKMNTTGAINKSDSIDSTGQNISNLIVLDHEGHKEKKHAKSNSCAKLPQAIPQRVSCVSPKKTNSVIGQLANYAFFGKSAKGNTSNLLSALSPKKKNPIITNTQHQKSCFSLENDSTAMKTKSNSIRTYQLNKTELLEFEMVNLETDEILEDESFCEAFYIVGLGKSSKIMKDSEDLRGACNHQSCNILPSLEPQLLGVYQGNSSLKNFQYVN